MINVGGSGVADGATDGAGDGLGISSLNGLEPEPEVAGAAGIPGAASSAVTTIEPSPSLSKLAVLISVAKPCPKPAAKPSSNKQAPFTLFQANIVLPLDRFVSGFWRPTNFAGCEDYSFCNESDGRIDCH